VPKWGRGADMFCVMCSLEGRASCLSKPWPMPTRNVDSLKLLIYRLLRERARLLPCVCWILL